MFWWKPRRAILSGHVGGDFDAIASVTYPHMQEYAKLHGLSFDSFPLSGSETRHASWWKLEKIAAALVDYDEVLWLDCDVAIVDKSKSIFDDFDRSAFQAAVEVTADPRHLNYGVWLLRKPMARHLVAAAMSDGFSSHCWWEQAAMHHLVSVRKIPTCVLGEEWNHWVGSPKEIVPRFRHGCGLTLPWQRLNTIKEWLNVA